MHKFFCNYNRLTERYELSLAKNSFFANKVSSLAENTLLPQIKNDIQNLYENVVLLKDNEQDENRLNILDETELLISNLYYSLFASPLELANEKEHNSSKVLQNSLELITQLEKNINIPEYNRLVTLIKNNIILLAK